MAIKAILHFSTGTGEVEKIHLDGQTEKQVEFIRQAVESFTGKPCVAFSTTYTDKGVKKSAKPKKGKE